MKKQIFFSSLTAIVLFWLCCYGVEALSERYLSKITPPQLAASFAGDNTIALKSPYFIKRMLNDPETIVYWGSSELSSNLGSCYPKTLFQGTNKNIVFAGAGGSQSLIHAVSSLAIQDSFPAKQFFIVSAQWFHPDGIERGALNKWFSGAMLSEAFLNTKNNNELLLGLLTRLFSVGENPVKLDLLPYYALIPLNHSLRKVALTPVDAIDKLKIAIKYHNTPAEIKTREISNKYQELLNENSTVSLKFLTNNHLNIGNDYYQKYIAPDLEKLRGSAKDLSYISGPEYRDLDLALSGFERGQSKIVIIPVNGLWYDYIGHPKSSRLEYYKKIAGASGSHSLETIDLSEHEYTPGFLADIMHIGWSGWCYLGESYLDKP